MAVRRKSKKTSKVPFILFDTNISYSMPMIPNDLTRYVENEQLVEGITIEQSERDGFVHATKSGYQDKWFIDVYFDWLLYTGYVKKEIKSK